MSNRTVLKLQSKLTEYDEISAPFGASQAGKHVLAVHVVPCKNTPLPDNPPFLARTLIELLFTGTLNGNLQTICFRSSCL